MGRTIYPAPGTPKPVQRVTSTWNSAANASVDVTISAVDPLKTKLSFLGAVPTQPGGGTVSVELVNATTIRFFGYQQTSNSYTARVEIYEHY